MSAINNQNLVRSNWNGRVAESQNSVIRQTQQQLLSTGSALGGRRLPAAQPVASRTRQITSNASAGASSRASQAAQNAGVAGNGVASVPAAPAVAQNGSAASQSNGVAASDKDKKVVDEDARLADLEIKYLLPNIVDLRGQISTAFAEIKGTWLSSKEAQTEKAFNNFSFQIEKFKAEIQQLSQKPGLTQNVRELIQKKCYVNLAVSMRLLGNKIVSNKRPETKLETRAAALIADAATLTKTFKDQIVEAKPKGV